MDQITDIMKPPKLRHCHFQIELKQVQRIDDPSTLIKLHLRRKILIIPITGIMAD